MPRLDLLVAHNLGLSRGVVTRLCRGRRVWTPEGEALTDPGLQIAPAELPRTVVVDHQPLVLHVRYHVMQHKPLGVVTALRDDRHATAYELLKAAPLHRDLRAVGRIGELTLVEADEVYAAVMELLRTEVLYTPHPVDA